MSENVRRRGGAALAFAAASIALLVIIVPRSVSLVGASVPGFFVWDNGVLVSLHLADWTGARAGLPLNGGLLTEVDGQPFSHGQAFMRAAAQRAPGEPIHYRVRTGETVSSHEVAVMRLEWSDWIFTLGSYLLNAFTLLFCATLALYLKPDHKQTRALAFASGMVGATTLLVIDALTEFRFVQLARFGEALAPAAILNLALVFPREIVSSRVRWLWTCAAAAAMSCLFAVNLVVFSSDPLLARQLTALTYVSIALAALMLFGNYASALLYASHAEERTRAAVVCAGGLPAFALAGFGILAFNVLDWTFSWSWVFMLLPLAPLSMLYAAVAQDLFDAERVLRLSVGYVLATGMLVLVYAAALTGIDSLFASGTNLNPASAFLLVLIVALLFDPLRRRIQRSVDRAFYRSDLDFAERLAYASEELPTLRSEDEIADFVGRHLREDLEVEFARLSLGDRAAGPAALTQPVVFRGILLGTLALGAKLSGTPFAPEERALVKAIAAQAALALHNTRTIGSLHAAERRLGIQDRLAAVGEFAGAIAHGIRNPLAGIRIGVEVARESSDNEEVRQTLSQVVDEADRLETRIRNILHYAEPYVLEKRRIELGGVLTEAADLTRALAARHGITVDVSLPSEPLPVEIDPNYMIQGLLELAKNGIEAMPEGGQLSFSLEVIDGKAQIAISDTGGGVSPHNRERIFDLFFTTRKQGTGIGLASVRRIVEAHDGQLELSEENRTGTTFVIQLPSQ